MTQEPDLLARADGEFREFRRVTELLLARLAARDLKEPRFRQDRLPDDLEELTAAAQVLRVLAKPHWSTDDLDLFDAYFPAAVRSEAFGDEFEEARLRIRSYIEQARQQLACSPPARAARR